MKRILIATLIAALALVACQPSPTKTPPAPDDTPSPATTPLGYDWSDSAPFQTGLTAAARAELPLFGQATMYQIDLIIGDDPAELEGFMQVQYTNREDTALGAIVFRTMPNILGGSLDVSAAAVDGQPAITTESTAGSVLTVSLPAPLAPGEKVLIDLTFSLRVPTSLETNYGILAYVDGVLALAHFYPTVAVYDARGWSTEIPAHQGDILFADAAYYIVRVNAPAAMDIVASGVEIDRASGDRQTVTYAIGPARDFYLALSTDLEKRSQIVGGVTINSYAPSAVIDGAERILAVAARSMEVFEQLYGPYPYTELDLVGTPTYALGIEYPGMIAMTSRLYDPNYRFSTGLTTSDYLEGTVAHEVGHQWFFNMVGNDQLTDPWLDESLTQYVTWVYFREIYGFDSPQAAGFEGSLEARWQRVENQPVPIGLPVSEYSDREYGAIVYGRGGLFFEALRQQIGDEAFDQFMQSYLREYHWQIANPEGMRSLAEQACGCDLGGLFTEWVYP